MSDKKSDDMLSMSNSNGHANGVANGRNGGAHKQPFPSFTPAQAKTDALKGLGPSMASLESSRGASVFAYCLSSMSMTIVNKYVVSGSNWNMNLLYLAVQVCLYFIAYLKAVANHVYRVVHRWDPGDYHVQAGWHGQRLGPIRLAKGKDLYVVSRSNLLRLCFVLFFQRH